MSRQSDRGAAAGEIILVGNAGRKNFSDDERTRFAGAVRAQGLYVVGRALPAAFAGLMIEGTDVGRNPKGCAQTAPAA